MPYDKKAQMANALRMRASAKKKNKDTSAPSDGMAKSGDEAPPSTGKDKAKAMNVAALRRKYG